MNKDPIKHDNGKLRLDLIPPEFEKAVATVLTFGAKKYGEHNWKGFADTEDGEARIMAALLRHLNAHRSGEFKDPESGLPHMWHVATNVAFLVWIYER